MSSAPATTASELIFWAAAPGLTAGQIGTLVLGLLVLAGGYMFACWFWPWTACGKCGGAGRFRSRSGKHWRTCPRCEGRGSQGTAGRPGTACAVPL